MANKCHIFLLLLKMICSLLKGTSGVEDTHVFCSSGENVVLPCNNAGPDCTRTTTWIYNGNSNSGTIELFYKGKKKNTERHERLSLGSNCSLIIYKASKEDYGSYTCQQYVNNQHQGDDARVYLHILHVSPSSTQTEIRPDSSVTLSCQLFLYYGGLCDTLVRSEGIHLLWVNQAGVDLQTDSRYQISSGNCISNLTTKLLNEDNNREWTCQVKKGTKVETSFRYSVKYSGSTDTTPVRSVTIPNSSTDTTPVRSVTIPNISTPISERTSTSKAPESPSQGSTDTTPVRSVTIPNSSTDTTPVHSVTIPNMIVIVVVIAALAVLLPAVLLCVILKKRAGNRREIQSNSTPDANEQTDDVTYSQVTVSGKKQVSKFKVHSDDKVTYASIRGATAGPHGGLQ